MRTSQQLRQERAKVLDEARTILKKVESTEGEPPQELVDQLDNAHDRAAKLTGEITTLEAREARISQLEQWGDEQHDIEARRTTPPEAGNDGASEFSFMKAIRQAVRGRLDGLEAEESQRIAEGYGVELSGNQFFVPYSLPLRSNPIFRSQRAEMRDVLKTNVSGAVPTIKPATLIEFLYNNMVVRSLGATILSDLTGDLSLPKATAVANAGWAAEGVAFGESSQTIGSVDLSPNRVGTFTEVSHLALRQTSIDLEDFLLRDLGIAVAIATDLAALNGSGTGSEPEGILQNGSVTTVALGTDGGAPTWAKIVEMESTIQTANALMGSLAYATTPSAKGKLKTTPKESGQATYIWDDLTNTMNGYPAVATTQLPNDLTKGTGTALSAMIFGDWSSILMGLWGGARITVNPYSLDTKSMTRITIDLMADIQLRYVESFSKIVDMITT